MCIRDSAYTLFFIDRDAITAHSVAVP